jgi:hypothetical protein
VVVERKMDCPLCRAEIAHFSSVVKEEKDTIQPVPLKLVEEFKKTRRAEYVSRLSGAGRSTLLVKPGFLGRGKPLLHNRMLMSRQTGAQCE